MWSEDVRRIIHDNCKTRHISLNRLREEATQIKSPTTFFKKLDDPNSFTILELQGICLRLRLNEKERAVLKKESTYEEQERKVRQS